MEGPLYNALKLFIMKFFLLIIILILAWVIYEFWRAPLLEETEGGGHRVIRPTKKLSDLWRKLS